MGIATSKPLKSHSLFAKSQSTAVPMQSNRDREKPRGSPLPHHRTNGSRIRRFGRLSQCAKHTAPARQPERHFQPRQRRFHPSHRACAPWTRRMQYRCSLASDFSSLSIPSRGTVRAFSDSRHLLRPLQTSAVRSARLSPRPVGVGIFASANNPADLPG
jgi:hypothetical protein